MVSCWIIVVVDDPPDDDPGTTAVDITNAIFIEDSADCAVYVNSYAASVLDITRALGFESAITISADDTLCTLSSDNIPNHDFNDEQRMRRVYLSTNAFFARY